TARRKAAAVTPTQRACWVPLRGRPPGLRAKEISPFSGSVRGTGLLRGAGDTGVRGEPRREPGSSLLAGINGPFLLSPGRAHRGSIIGASPTKRQDLAESILIRTLTAILPASHGPGVLDAW